MNCRDCRHALMRSESPNKHYSYEGCGIGIIPMMPTLPESDHDCRMWEQGKVKAPQGVALIWGTDIEL